MEDQQRVRPYTDNPFYWQHKGRPILLLGGSIEDNLFQIPDLEAHLDLLARVGGNYVRCTMSSRDEGDVWPFARDPGSGLYDLSRPGEEYWGRFERFLRLTQERDIIVQIELWDRFDFARAPWQDNPYNPGNNCNYTAEASGLAETITTHPGLRENAFFRTVPALENNQEVLPHQHRQIDWLLTRTLQHRHVLYCMDNETNESPAWGAYWAGYLRDRAAAAGVALETTEMWDDHNLLGGQHANTLGHPELYSFVDLSQNNHQTSETHWSNLQAIRQQISDSGHIRPLNSVKVYGANSGRYGSTRDGQERFWRNVFGGLAAVRFHRPPSGLGLGPIAQAHIRSMRMLSEAVDLFSCVPRQDLLHNRSWNEAYCTAHPGSAYAVFFPDGGDIELDTSAAAGKALDVRWLDIRASTWVSAAPDARPAAADGRLRLATPREEGYWAALVQAPLGTPLAC